MKNTGRGGIVLQDFSNRTGSMFQQIQKPQLKILMVQKDPTTGVRTLKRDGGGPMFDISDKEWNDIKEGRYDLPK